MIRKEKYVITSTNLDKQGYIISKRVLESMLPQLNGLRKPRLGLEHIRTFPPFGVIMNGEIIQLEDHHYYLTAEMVYFDKQEIITLDDDTKLLKESFSEGEYPFIECEENETSKISIGTDPANFETRREITEIYNEIKEEINLDFDTHEYARKSELPDPETIITITKILASALGIIKTKIPEKLGETIGEDLANFYKLISKLSIETIKKIKPANRPKNFVITYPNKECNIELIVTTHIADRVVNSLTKEKLQIIANKVEHLINLDPEKIQFIYSENDNWEFNYLLSKNGSVIGTIKSFSQRNELYNKILEKQENQIHNKN
ncbi:hypothetical protein [Flavobacterium oreochromis]|uniref:hypothetical protein n=1 Tax=Flavobacterium oreochromis TaxID=2906078 RepID=UPI00385B7F21